jgi:hypothetical protein
MIGRVKTPSHNGNSFEESVPGSAHATVLNWMQKKYQLVKSQPIGVRAKSNSMSMRPKTRAVDAFVSKLKLEHRSSPGGRQVLNLPKTPYGKHRTYNEDTEFMRRHIVDCKNPPDDAVIRELDRIARKFKLVEKRSRPKISGERAKYRTFKFREFEGHIELETKTGMLVCPVNRELVDSYEDVKKKYHSLAAPKAVMQTYSEAPARQNFEQYKSRLQSPTGKVKEVIDRLYKSPQRAISRMATSYERKYQRLFEATDQKNSTWDEIAGRTGLTSHYTS